MNELDLLAWLRGRLPSRSDVALGPGDDCALLNAAADAPPLAATCDTLLEDVHFASNADPHAIGYKAVAVNLSDLAAMGCAPRWALVGCGLRRNAGEAWVRALVEGMALCAEQSGLALVGGDIASGNGPTSITITALGSPFPGGPVRRSGARPGDILAVTGALGGSILGRHLSFQPRLAESESLCASGAVRAMMDISDGLALDLRRLCAESDVGAIIREDTVPIHADAHILAERNGEAPLHHALCDGEDFELLVAIDPSLWTELDKTWQMETPITAIGVATSEKALLLVDGEQEKPFPEGGFVHEL